MSDAASGEPLLEVRDLAVEFTTDDGAIRAVDRVSFSVQPGRTLAIVGESGCGKSVTALSILRLVPDPPARIASGSILFSDSSAEPPSDAPIDLAAADEHTLCTIRGRRISMIFQEAMTALNPVMTVGRQVAESFELHQGMNRRAAWNAVVSILGDVGIAEPDRRARDYPHQLSGGMRQRVMIAMALACRPAILIADEPTTALDVTVQAQILALLREQQARTGMSILFITHDLGVVAQLADDVSVMYAGRVVESAPVQELFTRPAHPYTQALLRCVPRLREQRQLAGIPGQVPDPSNRPTGCAFHPRCPIATERCSSPDGEPPLEQFRAGHHTACWEARP